MQTIHLVGAGPGDPDLITRRGAELLARADVVLHDALLHVGMLELARADAEVVDVGRRAGEPGHLDQQGIVRLMARHARAGRSVVRLKGGDPFVFGRGGEEVMGLKAAGVPVEVVPGVTSGVGALAWAGIPLTHRDVSTSALFVTAHRRGDPEGDDRWRRIAAVGGTLVVYMGGRRLEEITAALVRHGRAPETPAAVVESGTLPAQRVTAATLADLAERAPEPVGPALIVVGEVVGLREAVEWLRRGPLAGRTVLVARARAQPSWIAEALRELGASVLEFPTVRSVDAAEPEALAAAVRRHAGGGGAGGGTLLFTGAAAVRGTLRALIRSGGDVRDLAGARLVAVGRGTVGALEGQRLRPDLALRSYHPGRVLAELRRIPHGRTGTLAGAPILLLEDGQESSALHEALEASGAAVERVRVAVRDIDARGRRNVERLQDRDGLHAVVLPSSSAAEALVAGGLALDPAVPVVAIGPSTAATAERLGLPRPRVPRRTGVPALLEEVTAVLSAAGGATAGGTAGATGREDRSHCIPVRV